MTGPFRREITDKMIIPIIPGIEAKQENRVLFSQLMATGI
jgi:hypothetical protein